MKKNYLLIPATLLAVIVFCLSGCKKDATPQQKSASQQTTAKASATDPLVLTPGGWIPKSHVHFIPNGHHLDAHNGHVIEIEDMSGKMISDLGERSADLIAPNKPQQNPITNGFNNLAAVDKATNSQKSGAPAVASDGWVANSEWGNGNPITFFSTVWVVPSAPPSTSNGQTIFIFNALESSAIDILQPVLQWGHSNAGGGNYWSIGNWYGWFDSKKNSFFAYTSLTTVSPGTVLEGIISNTGTNSDGSYNFNVLFSGYGNSLTVTEGARHGGEINNVNGQTVTFPYINPETYAYETIESYNSVNHNGGNGVVSPSDYPTQLDVPMTAIYLYTNGSPAPLHWGTQIGTYATVGEHAVDINDSSYGITGEVDLYFHPAPPPVFTYWTPDAFTINKPITALNPSNTGAPALSYSISPTLPAGLTINGTTGVISGTPTALSAATNYTVTATSANGGHGSFTLNLAIVNGAFTFICSTNSTPSIYFNLSVSGGPQNGTFRIGQGQMSYTVNMPCTLSSNSTVVVTIPTGVAPAGGAIYGLGAPIYANTVGNTITFTGVNLTAGTSCNLVLN